MAGLTERQIKCLEYVKQAQDLGVSFAELCRRFNLNANTWYSMRLSLVRKGVIAGRAKEDKPRKARAVRRARFAEIRVAPPTATVICRIRHPSGWAIECASWPEVSWMAALFAAGEHAAP